MTYYFMETMNPNSFCKAEALKANTLTAAKREASRKSCFYGTTITIGTRLLDGSDGFIESAVKPRLLGLGI